MTHRSIAVAQSAFDSVLLLLILTWCLHDPLFVRPAEALLSAPSVARTEDVSVTPTTLQERIRQHVRQLGYSDQIANDFIKMLNGWKDEQARPALPGWQLSIDEARQAYAKGKITKASVALVEQTAMTQIAEQVRKQLTPNDEAFELTSVITKRQFQCVSGSMLLYILGNSLGLLVEVIEVDLKELKGRDALLAKWGVRGESGHVASLITLSDRTTMMADPSLAIVITAFPFEEAFTNAGHNWALRTNNSPVVYGRIRHSILLSIIYNRRGVSHWQLGQHAEAMSDFAKAIELDPNNSEAYLNRGLTYNTLGQHAQAISDCTKALELDPNNATAYLNRGNAYSASRQHGEALFDYNKAITLNPKYTRAYLNRAAAYTGLGQHTQATSDFAKAIELDPNNADAYFERGSFYATLGQHAEAISDCSKAIELNPKYILAYYNRGICYEGLGQHTQAISELTKTIALDPKYANAYYSRSVCYISLRKYREAKTDLETALKWNQDGKLKDAITAWMKVIDDALSSSPLR
jgi:tetratricopeptide (TPR) repeat protein